MPQNTIPQQPLASSRQSAVPPAPNGNLIEIAAINERGRRRLKPNNTPHYKSLLVLELCVREFFEKTLIENAAHIILTSTECCGKKANKKLSRIQEFLRRSGIPVIWYLHRYDAGPLHYHILAALPYPVVESYVCGQSTSDLLHYLDPHAWEEAIERELSQDARTLRRKLSEKAQRAGLGRIVKIQPILFPDAIGRYCARYLRGSSVRFHGDKHLRMGGVSKCFRVANSKIYIDTPSSRNARLKCAAYCGLMGWKSFAEARANDGKWQYHSREFLRDKLTGLYLYEEDFAIAAGFEFAPHLLGIEILYSNASLGLEPIPYLDTVVPIELPLLNRLIATRRNVLPLSVEQWFRWGGR